MSKLFNDFFPVLLFFAGYKLFDIYVATGILMASFTLQIIISYFRNKKVQRMHLISLIVLLVFGTITLVFRNEMFIKWKPTVLNWILGLVFLLAPYFGNKKTIIERMMGKELTLDGRMWKMLNLSWVFFFIFVGGANIYVAYEYATDVWVNFKLWGNLVLTIIFALIQGLIISKMTGGQIPIPKSKKEVEKS